MKQSRFSDEQIVGLLKQAEAGVVVKESCRKCGFSDATFCKWRARIDAMQASDTERLRDIEAQDSKLKELLADALAGPAHGVRRWLASQPRGRRC